MATLRIAGQTGQKLVIAVHGYERDHSDNLDDANWLRCSVSAEIGHFRGDVEAALSTRDFAQFLSALKELSTGAVPVARLRTDEDALEIQVQAGRLGRMTCSGTINQTDEGSTSLTFTFPSDVTYLSSMITDLQQIVDMFPVRTG
jgi:hypothetical protein